MRTKKYRLWHEAYIFKLVNAVFWDFAKTNLQLSESSANIFVKSSSKTITIKITSTDPTILSILKINFQDLENEFQKVLNPPEKNPKHNLEIKFAVK